MSESSRNATETTAPAWLAEMRRDYTLGRLRRRELSPDPILQFQKWLEEAAQAKALEPNAMTLATVNNKGQPSARTVLLKGLDARGFVFFTHYTSAKGRDLAENPRAALVFHWRELERQVSVCGTAARISPLESEAYFKLRPHASRLAAWASRQSETIPDRQWLDGKFADAARKYPGEDVSMPPYWGGYVVTPATMEFWQGGASRLHDRFRYTRQDNGTWVIERLSP
ncbi:MAG: pyridoxamine 5'-phosphate oxidase [Verrucomicrobiota bacterium]|jgi:pyridoxamine 5'-phosphate oxidase